MGFHPGEITALLAHLLIPSHPEAMHVLYQESEISSSASKGPIQCNEISPWFQWELDQLSTFNIYSVVRL